MSYKAGIISAITELKERTGSSSIDIKKVMQANLPEGKKWMDATYLVTLKMMVARGELVQTKGSYKVSADFKTASKNQVAAPLLPNDVHVNCVKCDGHFVHVGCKCQGCGKFHCTDCCDCNDSSSWHKGPGLILCTSCDGLV